MMNVEDLRAEMAILKLRNELLEARLRRTVFMVRTKAC